MSLAILTHTALCYPTMPSLQRRFGLLTDLTHFICHSVLLIVHLVSFIRMMCPAHFHFALVMFWTMSVTLVLCLKMVLPIPSFSLTLIISVSMVCWLVSSLFTNALARDHVWHPHVIAGKTHWLKDSWEGACLERCLCILKQNKTKQPLHHAFIGETFCFVLVSIAVVCPRYL